MGDHVDIIQPLRIKSITTIWPHQPRIYKRTLKSKSFMMPQLSRSSSMIMQTRVDTSLLQTWKRFSPTLERSEAETLRNKLI